MQQLPALKTTFNIEEQVLEVIQHTSVTFSVDEHYLSKAVGRRYSWIKKRYMKINEIKAMSYIGSHERRCGLDDRM